MNLDTLIYTLLHTLWQGGLILLLLFAAFAFVQSPRARYLLSVTALAAVLLAGVFTWAWLSTPTAAVAMETAPVVSEIQSGRELPYSTTAAPYGTLDAKHFGVRHSCTALDLVFDHEDWICC